MERKILNLSKGILHLLFCTSSLPAFTQNIAVTGTVTDVTGESLPGVNVVIMSEMRNPI